MYSFYSKELLKKVVLSLTEITTAIMRKAYNL